MWSQVDMYSCNDTCTHSKQGVALEDFQDYQEIDPHSVTTYQVRNWSWTVGWYHKIGTTAPAQMLA